MGIALMICAAGICAALVLYLGFDESGYLILIFFLLISSYGFITQASNVWAAYDYKIQCEGGRLFFVKHNRRRTQVLFDIQVAAVTSMHFAIGKPKHRKLGEWRLNASLARFERGLMVYFTVLGQPRQQLVSMPGITRPMALVFEQRLRAWLQDQELAIPIESFKRVPIDEDRLPMA